MKRIDCVNTKSFLIEWGRMCQFYHQESETCNDCPLKSGEGNNPFFGCGNLASEYPNTAIKIVQKWSDDHPIKTRLDDLLEKYPNFHIDNGRPDFYPRVFGYCDNCGNCPIWNDDDYVPGKSCWDEPFKNGMTGDY